MATSENFLSDNISYLHRVAKPNFALSLQAVRDMHRSFPIHQIQWLCKRDRIIHIATSLDKHGNSIVQYVLYHNGSLPSGCTGYYRFPDDTSNTFGNCGRYNGQVNMWFLPLPRTGDNVSMFQHPFVQENKYFFYDTESSRMACDEDMTSDAEKGSWRIYVR